MYDHDTMDGDPTEPRRRSFRLSGHRTSLSLERAFWGALKDIANADGRTMTSIIEEVDETRTGGLTSAVRVYILEQLRHQRRNQG